MSMKRGDSRALLTRIRQLAEPYRLAFLVVTKEPESSRGVNDWHLSDDTVSGILEAVDDYEKTLAISPRSTRETQSDLLVE